ncbi:Mdm20p [Lachancea thermotolerans CBS 6340]|uniref:KLTH0G16016p n=1 Tax=Lachancea thermotolerans (strain ATCC 56472 / CBS 6340 / NRRL Y-8284) TaxID=559295 RepID=C5DND2_LACTC|nr:KLTH0G16016p [Lachancea thermotolerans CBS 6340]CAR25293.1 KLTH0G16016p [Lachancea thermotolerans CBS 6340]
MESTGDEIYKLLSRGNFKQALQLVAKLSTQYPSASYPKVLTQYVKFRQNKQKFDFFTGLEPLLKAKSPPSDSRTLSLLHTFLLELGRFDEVLNVYGAAMQKYPNFETGSNWFSRAIEDMNLRHMVQSSFQLRRLSNDLRTLQFWNAMASVALTKLHGESLSERERELNAALSFKSVSSLAPFQSDQETIVFCHVCEQFDNKSREIVDTLLPSFLKGGKDFSVDLYLKNFLIKHLKVLNDNENMFKCCKLLLEYLDDFEILSHLVASARALNVSKEEVRKHLQVRDSRNHRLAHLELDVIYSQSISDETLRFYLERYHDKPCCVPDLSFYRKSIPDGLIERGMTQLPDSLMHECNAIKLTQATSPDLFLELFKKYKQTLRKKPKTDYSPCSSFVLKIVESLINDKNVNLSNVVTSVLILESYQDEDPHNFDTRIWLVVLYNYLGCPTIAYNHYKELHVKNLQNDTLDHIVASRFSSLLPFKDHPFVEQLSSGDKVYESLINLPQFIRISFEKKSYSKILGMLELNDKLNRSSARWSKIGEQLQHARLFNDKRGELLAKLHESWRHFCLYNVNASGEKCVKSLHLSDNRDFAVLGSLRDSCTTVTGYMDQDEGAILAGCLQEMMIEFFSMGERDPTIDKLLDIRNYTASMTATERWAFETIRLLYQHSPDQGQAALAEQIKAMPKLSSQGWLLTHDYNCQLVTLKTLDNLKRIKNQECKKSIKTQLRGLRDSCKDVFQSYIAEISSCEPNTEILNALGYADAEHHIAKGVLAVLKSSCNL